MLALALGVSPGSFLLSTLGSCAIGPRCLLSLMSYSSVSPPGLLCPPHNLRVHPERRREDFPPEDGDRDGGELLSFPGEAVRFFLPPAPRTAPAARTRSRNTAGPARQKLHRAKDPLVYLVTHGDENFYKVFQLCW
jgi:hypothetical protein